MWLVLKTKKQQQLPEAGRPDKGTIVPERLKEPQLS